MIKRWKIAEGLNVRELPRWLRGRESAYPCWRPRRHRFKPWVGTSPWRERMATHSSILGWKIPWTKEPGRLQYMGPSRLRHDSASTQGMIITNYRSIHLTSPSARMPGALPHARGPTVNTGVTLGLDQWCPHAGALPHTREPTVNTGVTLGLDQWQADAGRL